MVFHFIRLTAERILVDADHFVIHENAAGFVAHLADVAADHQRGAKECPQCIVCLILDIAAAGQSNISFSMHADDQHVHIVEAADAVVRMQFFLLCHEIFDRIPGIKDVAGGTPHGSAGFFDPLMRFISTPGAGREENVAAAVLECQSHAAVQIFSVQDRTVVAVVVF